MSQIIAKLPNIYDTYKKWVSANPQVVGDLETTIKWLSYFLVGRMNSSSIVSELIFALSNLLVLFNDRIIENARTQFNANEKSEYKLKLLLTTLEYSEVFIELSAAKLWGEPGRWFFITILQVVKFIVRYVLKARYRECVSQSPAIAAFDRKNIDHVLAEATANEISAATFGGTGSMTFTLKRSGKVVRKVEGSPPVYLRSWKPLCENGDNSSSATPHADFALQRISFAEMLYITKPIVHLASIGTFGKRSWKSYCIALFMDLYSLRLYRKNRRLLNKKQRLEISRRTVAMLLYMLRTPFYEIYSSQKIDSILNAMVNTIPFSKAICDPIRQYVPHWQNTYFYMWSS